MDNLRIGSKNLIKDLNKSLVLDEIRKRGPISRTQISHNIKLGLSTITKICDELLEQNLIFDGGEGKSTGGRKPINLLFNNNYGYIIAVKIEKRQIILALTNMKPLIIETRSYPFALKAAFQVVEKLLVKGIEELIQQIKESGKQLLGIGVAVSGIVDHENGRLISSPFLDWKNINLKEILQEKFSVDVYVDNDVNCYTLSQKWFGKGKDCRNFVCINISEGIGAGVFTDGRLYRGAVGGAGEIGHMIIYAGGRQCYCGQRGCLEAYASFKFITDFVTEKKGRECSIEEILEMAIQGDPVCAEAMRTAGEHIGWGLINVVMHYDPEKIIIGGEGIKEKDFMIPFALKIMNENWFHNLGAIDTMVEIDELGKENFLLGASILALSELLLQPIYENRKTLINSF